MTTAPHCPLGPIAPAASPRAAFATPNFLIQEQSLRMRYNVGTEFADYLVGTAPFTFTDGYVARLSGPGPGIDIDEAAVRPAAEIGHAWRSPLWRHDDGSFAEW